MASASRVPLPPPKKVDPLATIDPKDEPTTVVVRVLRKWPVYLKKGTKKPSSLELLLVDSEGTKIQGHIDQMHIYKHDKCIQEGGVYVITKFAVALNSGEYRAARHEYRLNFGLKTNFKPTTPNTVPTPPYSFTPPEDCFDSQFDMDYFVDVAGILIGVGTEQQFQKDSITISRMKIDLDNRGYRFSVTLFGNYVTEINNFLSDGNTANAVIAVLLAKVSSWRGFISIQSTKHSTRLLINPDIAEATALRESATHTIASPALTVSQFGKSGSSQHELLQVEQRYTVSDMKELEEVVDFVLLATVDSIVDDVDWWYWACQCSKKVMKDEDLFYCPKCDTHVTKVTRKYLLKLCIIDETDSVTVVLFDHMAAVLIGRSCTDVFDGWIQDPGRDCLPIELKGLKGKEALFRIQCDGVVGGRYPRSYRAKNISDDRDLIDKYKAKWTDDELSIVAAPEVLLIEDTPSNGVKTVQKNGDDISQDLMGKFEQSVVDSNASITTKDTVDITTDTDETPPSKRKIPIDCGSSSMPLPLKTVKIEK